MTINNKSAIMVKLNYVLMIFVGISGVFAVLFSAWLAHAGANLIAADQRRLVIAVAMQFIHTLVLLVTLVWYRLQNSISLNNEQLYQSLQRTNTLLSITAVCFALGILCFSGALYLKTFHLLVFFGKLAPFGGMLLAFGWLMLAVTASFRK